jgi:hypothetical protein
MLPLPLAPYFNPPPGPLTSPLNITPFIGLGTPHLLSLPLVHSCVVSKYDRQAAGTTGTPQGLLIDLLLSLAFLYPQSLLGLRNGGGGKAQP